MDAIKTTVSHFTLGFNFIFSGFKQVKRHPKLRSFIFWPLVIDILIFVLGLYWFGPSVPVWTKAIVKFVVANPEGFFGNFLFYGLYVLLFAGFIVCLFLIVYVLASIIAAPFNALLAETNMRIEGIKLPEYKGLKEWIKANTRLLGIGILKAGLFLGISFILFGLSWVPILNLVAAFGALVIMAFDLMDYALEALGLNLKQRFNYFFKNFPIFCGMATALSLTVLIPGLTFFLLPFGVIGASRVLCKIPPPGQVSPIALSQANVSGGSSDSGFNS